jgi:hypothetical protein
MEKDNSGKKQDIFANSCNGNQGSLLPSFRNTNSNFHSNPFGSMSEDSPFQLFKINPSFSLHRSIKKYSFYGDEVTYPPFLSDYDNNYRYRPPGSIPKEKVTIPSDLNSSNKRIVGDYLFQLIRSEGDEGLQEFLANSLLKTFDFNENKVSLPSCLWNFHSNHFEAALEEFGTCDNFEYQDDVSQESVQLFAQALKKCHTWEILNLKNLKDKKNFRDLRFLADKYHVQWLINDCNKYSKFFNIYGNLIKEADFKNSEGVFLALEGLSKININESDNETLAQVAEKYQLADLHLFCLTSTKLLPENGLSVSFSNINDVIIGLDKKNSWHSPTLVFDFWQCLNEDLLKEVLNKTSLSPVFSISNVNTKFPEGLNDKLMSNPEIKHLSVKIENDRQDMNAISEFIKGNTTLKSLHVEFFHNPEMSYGFIPHFSDNRDLIFKAFNLNKTLQKFTTEGDLIMELKKPLPAGSKF